MNMLGRQCFDSYIPLTFSCIIQTFSAASDDRGRHNFCDFTFLFEKHHWDELV